MLAERESGLAAPPASVIPAEAGTSAGEELGAGSR